VEEVIKRACEKEGKKQTFYSGPGREKNERKRQLSEVGAKKSFHPFDVLEELTGSSFKAVIGEQTV